MKKIYTLITVTVFCFSANAQAPNWAWAKRAGGTGGEYGYGIATDANANVVATGAFGSPTVTFGSTTLTNAGGTDMYVTKYDSSGNVLWARRAGGTNNEYGFGIATDGNGNVLVTGYFTSASITFGSTTLTNAGNTDMFIVQYDASGNVLWAKRAGGTGFDYGQSVDTDANGNVLVTGYFVSPTIVFGSTTLTNAGGADMFIVQYDASGNVLWANRAGGTGNDYGYGVSTDASGNVLVTGYFGSPTIIFGSTTLTNAGSNNMFVVKYDASGNVLWAKSAGGTNSDAGNGVAADANGNVLVTGQSASSTITFGTTTLTNAGGGDMFVVKYDASGNVLWAKNAGGTNSDVGYGVAPDVNGNVFVTGAFASSSITFGSTTLTNAGVYDMYIVKYDASGNEIWAKSTGGANNEYSFGVATDGNGNAFITGYFNSPTITFGSTTLTTAGAYDMFVAKLNICSVAPPQPGTISGPTTVCDGSTNTYSIAAVSGATSYTWVLPGGWTGTSTTTSINATASSTGGNITVTANNACGSSSVQTLTVTVNNVGASASYIPVLCNGGNTGEATAIPSGTGPFTYLWSNTQTTQTATGLIAGTYTVTVTGAGGCTATTSITVTQPTVFSVSPTSSYTSCGTCCDGSATANASGGTAPFTYLWTPSSQVTATATGLCNGTYTVCATDANGCTTCSTVSVSFNVGVEQNVNENELVVYPNPFTDVLTISGLDGTSEISLFNVLGELVLSNKVSTPDYQLSTSDLQAGVYLLQVKTKNGTVTKRIVKE